MRINEKTRKELKKKRLSSLPSSLLLARTLRERRPRHLAIKWRIRSIGIHPTLPLGLNRAPHHRNQPPTADCRQPPSPRRHSPPRPSHANHEQIAGSACTLASAAITNNVPPGEKPPGMNLITPSTQEACVQTAASDKAY